MSIYTFIELYSMQQTQQEEARKTDHVMNTKINQFKLLLQFSQVRKGDHCSSH